MGVRCEDSPTLYSNGADTLNQRPTTGAKISPNSLNQKSAFSRLPKNHRAKTTDYLGEADLIDITLAAKTAHDIGRPFNLAVAVHIKPNNTLERPQDVLAGYLWRLRRWLAKYGHPITFFWILEKPVGKSLHAHLMLHIPLELQTAKKPNFHSWQQRAWYQTGIELNADTGIIQTEPIGPRGYDSKTASKSAKATYLRQLCGALKYHCKAINPEEISQLAADITAADLFRIKPSDQGTIHGRRYSRSMNISEQARTKLRINSAITDFKAHTAAIYGEQPLQGVRVSLAPKSP